MSDSMSVGFAPLVGAEPRLLILGSLPGVKSLEQSRYYAHPRNAFWPIMGAFFGFDPAAVYENRVDALLRHPVIVWDVLGSAERKGSLDSAIVSQSAQVNAFQSLFERFNRVHTVMFNGKAAEALFRKHVRGDLDSVLDFMTMPSTSPAYAAMSIEAKREIWHRGLRQSLGAIE